MNLNRSNYIYLHLKLKSNVGVRYYKGKPTCVAAHSVQAWTKCDTNRYICAGVGHAIAYYGYMRNQLAILQFAVQNTEEDYQVEGCPLKWDIDWVETESAFCAPSIQGMEQNYTQIDCETLCYDDPMCSGFSFTPLHSVCQLTIGQVCTVEQGVGNLTAYQLDGNFHV